MKTTNKKTVRHNKQKQNQYIATHWQLKRHAIQEIVEKKSKHYIQKENKYLLKIGQGPVVLDGSRNSLGALNTDAV